MNHERRATALLLGATLLACGPTRGTGELDGGSSASSDDTSASASESSSNSVTASATDPSASTSSAGSASASATDSGSDGGSDGGSDTGGCGASVCDPQPDGVTEADFVIDGDPSPFTEVSDLELPCTIESVEGDAPVIVTLACTVEDAIVMHTIEANVPTTLNIVPGSDVNFSHFVWVQFWSEEWFSLRWEGENVDNLIVAGIRGGTLLPQPIVARLVVPEEPFYGNVMLDAVDDVCELEPLCETNDCAQDRRHAIAVATGNDEALVYDGQTDTVGNLNTAQIRVAEARSLENMQCDDVPDRSYRIVVVNTSEG